MPTMRTAPSPRPGSVTGLLTTIPLAKSWADREHLISTLCCDQNCRVVRFFAPILGTFPGSASSKQMPGLPSALRTTPTPVGTQALTGSLRLHDHVLQPRGHAVMP